MRLRTVNRLSVVSSAIVASLLAGSGCQHNQPTPPQAMAPAKPVVVQPAAGSVKPQPVKPVAVAVKPVTQAEPPVTRPVVVAQTKPAVPTPATSPATEPTTQASTQPVTQDASPPTDPDVIASDVTLADRISGMAELEFAIKINNPDAWPWIWKHQTAMLRACTTLNPRDPRYPRLMADAYRQLHDTTGEQESLVYAINAQMVSNSQPDIFSWNRDLDLHLDTFQTAPDKLKYLDQIINTDSVPDQVKAHAGFRKAHIMLDRGDEESASTALDDALKLCPSSLECLKLRYTLLPPTATDLQRCTQLLDLLSANPMQPELAGQLANLVAKQGLVQESLPWFNLAIAVLHKQGDPAPQLMLNLAAELYIADSKPEALRVLNALLKSDPTNPQAHLLNVIIMRSVGDKDGLSQALQQAGNALSNRVIEAVNAAAPADATKATTRPISDTDPIAMPDLGVTVAQLNQSKNAAVKDQFAEAVADMALLQGYLANQPELADKLVDALKGVVADDAPAVARLRGWDALLANKPDDAKALFTPVAAEDPLAELGLVEALLKSSDPRDHQNAQKLGEKLLTAHPSGLLGAMIWEKLHADRIKLVPTTQAAAFAAPLAAYPQELMDLVQNPRQVYSVHVRPVNIGSYIGEPLLAEVTIANLTKHDLTIGPDGEIKPELLFRLAPLLGDKPPTFEAFDSMAGPMILSSLNDFSQIVRLDQTQMLAYLNTQPTQAFEIQGMLAINQVVQGLGGQSASLSKNFYRQSTLLANMQAVGTHLSDGRPDQKLTALSQIQLYILQLHGMKDPPKEAIAEMGALMEALHHAKLDPLPAVAAWASKTEAELTQPAVREQIIRDMAEDPDWRHRQLALMLLGGLDRQTRDDVMTKLLVDRQTSVRDDAIALQGIFALPPSTQPTTEPATQPITAP